MTWAQYAEGGTGSPPRPEGRTRWQNSCTVSPGSGYWRPFTVLAGLSWSCSALASAASEVKAAEALLTWLAEGVTFVPKPALPCRFMAAIPAALMGRSREVAEEEAEEAEDEEEEAAEAEEAYSATTSPPCS